MSEPRRAPRFTGVRTFAGLAHTALEELFAPAQAGGAGRPAAHPRAVVVGVPFDTATSWRAGARFGPEAIRSASALLRPFHAVHGVSALAAVTDAGDVAITPGNAARSSEQIAATLAPVCRSATVPLVLGGDHLVALGELRAQAAAHGSLALVLLDAHADTWEDYYGERLFHGTVLRRAADADTEATVTVGELTVDLAARRVLVSGEEMHLTPIEFDLLRVLAVHRGKLVTHRQLLHEVWGPQYAHETHYLRVHVAHIRAKIEADPSRPQLLVTDPGVGYRLRDP